MAESITKASDDGARKNSAPEPASRSEADGSAVREEVAAAGSAAKPSRVAEAGQPPGGHSVGTAAGINIEPGSDDDGWCVPPPVRLHDGTWLQLYKDGEALHAAFEAIRDAKQLICLEVYIFADDPTGRAFADLLCEKARQGLRVYVIFDSFGSILSERSMFDRMRRAGVKVAEFHPMRPWEVKFGWRPFNRDHRKLLIVDHDRAGLGGLNVGAEYAGSWIVKSDADVGEFWRDNAIGLHGPATRPLLQSFARSWNYVAHGGPVRRAQLIHDIPFAPGEHAHTDFGVLASVPTLNSPLRPSLKKLFGSARQSILMTMAYFAPDDDLVAELCRAAKRGVRVRLMLPGRSDAKILIAAARWFYEKLLEFGIEIYERNAVILHAKTTVIDGRLSVIGSTNLDYRSIEYNCELSAVVRSREFGKQMHALFENDVRYARRIRLGEWRRRPFVDRVGQWAVSRTRYLL